MIDFLLAYPHVEVKQGIIKFRRSLEPFAVRSPADTNSWIKNFVVEFPPTSGRLRLHPTQER